MSKYSSIRDAATPRLSYPASSSPMDTKASMPMERYLLAAGTVDGLLYALGDLDTRGTTVATNQAYTP